jgi:c-di-GMP-binding flagellar brake protein YcgR
MALNDGPDRYYYGAGDIFGVFRSLQTERSTVNVQFDDSAQLYNTMILDANLQERYFLIDEVTPRDGHRKIEEGSKFSLRASIHGIKVHAKDLVSARTLNNRDGIYYQVPFPAKILYLQRREAFRAYVPGSMMTTVRYSSTTRTTELFGRVLNMSATGIRVAFPGEVMPEFDPMEKLDASIQIHAQEHQLVCEVEIIYYQYNKERDQTMCGCRFVNLHRSSQIIVNRFVTFLQREELV